MATPGIYPSTNENKPHKATRFGLVVRDLGSMHKIL
ncbi:hypothetical protein A2U01_0058796, partial [Trifolium medium]|nr:hypothetical protein [Trifolium medium]